jgi:hypothetical protein
MLVQPGSAASHTAITQHANLKGVAAHSSPDDWRLERAQVFAYQAFDARVAQFCEHRTDVEAKATQAFGSSRARTTRWPEYDAW